MKTEKMSATPWVEVSIDMIDPQKYIDGCLMGCRRRFSLLILAIALAGYGRARVICGIRSIEEESKIFGKGRSSGRLASYGVGAKYSQESEKRVSWVRPEKSSHVKRTAIDISFDMYVAVDWELIRKICNELSITWGGNWSHVDKYHFEI